MCKDLKSVYISNVSPFRSEGGRGHQIMDFSTFGGHFDFELLTGSLKKTYIHGHEQILGNIGQYLTILDYAILVRSYKSEAS